MQCIIAQAFTLCLQRRRITFGWKKNNIEYTVCIGENYSTLSIKGIR